MYFYHETTIKRVDSKSAAKERLHLVLMQDRANVSADFLDLMRQEIIDVIQIDNATKETMSLNENLIESDKLKVVEGSVDKLPYKNDFFDRAITVESFYFWPNPVENLKEVLRVLKPNGKFLLVADIYEKASLSQRARENIRMFKMLNPTPEDFVSMFKQAGFTKTEIKTKAQTDWIAVLGIK